MVVFRGWISSQVAAYRVGLVLGYLAMIYFGTSAYITGIQTFQFTTPEDWTPIWSSVVVLGGLIGSIGSLRAGTEPANRHIRIFNRIELVGAIMLFLTLGTYAALLLIIGYGYGDGGRASAGAGFVALGIHPTVRMLWLIFRPRFMAIPPPAQVQYIKTAAFDDPATGPVPTATETESSLGRSKPGEDNV